MLWRDSCMKQPGTQVSGIFIGRLRISLQTRTIFGASGNGLLDFLPYSRPHLRNATNSPLSMHFLPDVLESKGSGYSGLSQITQLRSGCCNHGGRIPSVWSF